MNVKELIEFEEEIKELFLEGKILAPIHLSVGSEKRLIDIFDEFDIGKDDWVFSTHRSHYHALLKGIPKDWVKKEILECRSIHIINKEYNFFTSAIVGGVLPIAVGAAMGIKRLGKENRVFVFVGDMCATLGVFYECIKYAGCNALPIVFVVEDNGFCTNMITQKTWGTDCKDPEIIRYSYDRKYPHQGCGKWVVF